jgi:hypothetical protein
MLSSVADILQTDRAQAKHAERIATPLGIFDTRKVIWLSRVKIKVKGRPLLEKLTSEPYRRETMWIAAGYGIIRRKIEYLGDKQSKKSVLFDLIKYNRP